MANPSNSATFPKEEHKLLDIMSDGLGKRLQIEDDFVWVMPEVQQITNMLALTKSDTVSSDSDVTPVANIVQSELKCKRFEFEDTDKPYDTEDSSVNQWDVDEGFDELYYLKCKNDSKKTVNTVKCTPTPRHMKYTEDSTRKMYNNSCQAHLSTAGHSNNSKKQKYNETSLLPSIDFGEPTNLLLKRLIDQRYVREYNHVVGMGKSSVVFYTLYHRRTCISISIDNAVKVYKLSKNENENKAVYKRVQREFEHLNIVCSKLRCCPMPYRAWDNVILMSFARCDDKYVAPTINDITPTIGMYWTIVRYIKKLYNELHLVHGKLCAKNIRCFQTSLEFIGWGHSVKSDHPLALPKLIKDCHFVTKFYTQRGFKVKATEELFKEITGCTKINSKLLDVIKKKDLYEEYDENPNRGVPSSIKPNGILRFK